MAHDSNNNSSSNNIFEQNIYFQVAINKCVGADVNAMCIEGVESYGVL